MISVCGSDDTEVWHCQHQPSQPLLERLVLVAEFVRGVEPAPGVCACDKGQRPEGSVKV